MLKQDPYHILIVEDSPSDLFLIKEALKQTDVPPNVHEVADGVEALAFLRREGAYATAPRPTLILLDLNLPRKDGRELLLEIKAHPDFRVIPVIVLTSSGAEQDLNTAYDRHANCYVVKPQDFSKLKSLIKALEEFWLKYVVFPPGGE